MMISLSAPGQLTSRDIATSRSSAALLSSASYSSQMRWIFWPGSAATSAHRYSCKSCIVIKSKASSEISIRANRSVT